MEDNDHTTLISTFFRSFNCEDDEDDEDDPNPTTPVFLTPACVDFSNRRRKRSCYNHNDDDKHDCLDSV